jgi:tetratricopeptide (TPR) repeat protein
MKKLLLLLLTVFAIQSLIACGQYKHKYDPGAIKLNDSAIALIMDPPLISNKGDSSTGSKIAKHTKGGLIKMSGASDTVWHPMYNDIVLYEKAVGLLNKATQIDSNYFIAYFNKCGFQCHLKRYSDALITGKEMVRIAPNDATVKFFVGQIYYKTGDTIQARAYYQNYLDYCNKKLDTMSVKNRHYKDLELQKGLVLIWLDRQQDGVKVFKKLWQDADDWEKDTYSLYMSVTKADLIDGKELTRTVGNNSVSVNLDL